MNPKDEETFDNCHEGSENWIIKGLKNEINDDILSFQSENDYIGLYNEETPSFLDDKIQRNARKSLTYKHMGDLDKIQALLNKNTSNKPPLSLIPERKPRADKKWQTVKYNNNLPITNKEGLECIEEYDFENNGNDYNISGNNNMYLSTNITNNSNNSSIFQFK